MQEVHGDKEGLIMRSGAPSGGNNSPFYPGPGGGNGPYNSNHSPTEYVQDGSLCTVDSRDICTVYTRNVSKISVNEK